MTDKTMTDKTQHTDRRKLWQVQTNLYEIHVSYISYIRITLPTSESYTLHWNYIAYTGIIYPTFGLHWFAFWAHIFIEIKSGHKTRSHSTCCRHRLVQVQYAIESPSTTSSSGRRWKANRETKAGLGTSLVVPHGDVGWGRNLVLSGADPLVAIIVKPLLKTFLRLSTGLRQCVLSGESSTLPRPLVLWNFGNNFHDMFALPWTGEGHAPEKAVNHILKSFSKHKDILGITQIMGNSVTLHIKKHWM